MRFKPVTKGDGSPYGVSWDCPGCEHPHVVPTVGERAWGFNGDMDRPTLTPSVLVYPNWKDVDGNVVEHSPRCHVFIRDGRIEFLSDCTHALAGQTVDMQDVP